jgi:hypothetical protein
MGGEHDSGTTIGVPSGSSCMRDGTSADDALPVRFCGGCNPVVDRGAIASEARRVYTTLRFTIYISGCQRACASSHHLRIDSEEAIVVAGEMVNGIATPADRVIDAVIQELHVGRS